MSQLTDTELVQRVLGGDKSAFGAIVERHDRSLHMLVYAMVREAGITDDVLQETYIKAYRSLGKFKYNSSLKTWLCRIAYNATIDELRKAKRSALATPDEDLNKVVDTDPTPESMSINRAELVQALGQLSPQQRAVVLMVDGHEFSYGEVASVLGVSAGAVGFHLNKARSALRKQLQSMDAAQ